VPARQPLRCLSLPAGALSQPARKLSRRLNQPASCCAAPACSPAPRLGPLTSCGIASTCSLAAAPTLPSRQLAADHSLPERQLSCLQHDEAVAITYARSLHCKRLHSYVANSSHDHTSTLRITLLPCNKATLLHHHMPTYVPCCHKTSLLQYHTTHRYPAITPATVLHCHNVATSALRTRHHRGLMSAHVPRAHHHWETPHLLCGDGTMTWAAVDPPLRHTIA
jgi:hypothetical protein